MKEKKPISNFHKYLRDNRLFLGLTVTELAKLYSETYKEELSYVSISNWEKRLHEPRESFKHKFYILFEMHRLQNKKYGTIKQHELVKQEVDRKNLSEMIKAFRTIRNLSYYRFAKLVNSKTGRFYSDSTIQSWEKRGDGPNKENMQVMKDFFNSFKEED